MNESNVNAIHNSQRLVVRHLGRCGYEPVWHAMQDYTDNRDADADDELWIVEHEPVFTQGQAGKAEHLLMPGDIPVVQVDRGGQVTYHGPGQLVVYFLLDIRRRKLGVRQLVNHIEDTIITMMAEHDVVANARTDAPGVYVEGRKLCSLGLRIRRGCSFHGLALNVNMDLEPFQRINPCGYAGMEMVQTAAIGGPQSLADAAEHVIRIFADRLEYSDCIQQTGLANAYVKAS
nr:lipoyl(octanoyl) transferase LipB [Idiomarina xiamenensis]